MSRKKNRAGISEQSETENQVEISAEDSSFERLSQLAESIAEQVAEGQASNEIETESADRLAEALNALQSENSESVADSLAEQIVESEQTTQEAQNLDQFAELNPELAVALPVESALQEELSDELKPEVLFGEKQGEMDFEAEESKSQDLEFVDFDRMVSIIESLLFAQDRPVSFATMRALFKGTTIRGKDIEKALGLIASSYADVQRGVTLEEINGGYQLRTKVDNAEFLKRLAKSRPFKLSGPSLEVMAITAYRQPITKSEVDQIRGVESGHLLRALMERGLVNFGEKSDLPGKPMTYVTTRKFLEIFGLRNLDELPSLQEIDELLPEGIGDEEEKQSLSDLTEGLSKDIGSSYSEEEGELDSIAESLAVIDTTSEFFEQEKIRQREERDRNRAQDIRERLTVGEMVEDKDQRWLLKYEQKLAAGESMEAEAVEVVADQEAMNSESASAQGIDDAKLAMESGSPETVELFETDDLDNSSEQELNS